MKKALQRVEITMLLSLLVSAPALASESDQYRACSDTARTQTDRTNCARDELSRVDAQLNKQAEYGSIYPMEVNLYLASLTQQHIGALADMLARYTRR
jgi:uncharacterized protein YecT (DUF1311 family)